MRRIVGTVAVALLAGRIASAREPLASFAPLVDAAAPAVVNITTQMRPRPETGAPENMQEFLRRFFERPEPRGGLGSGFIVTADGDILTNRHVVANADRVRVQLSTEETFDARIIGTDEMTDVALIHVKAPRPLPTLSLGDSESLRVGDWVLAIGNPFGLQRTATAGIVSAKGRFLGAGPYDDFIQTDAPINPGNSGGPLIDQTGKVVGINAVIVAPSGGNVGIGFAIPIALVRWVSDQLHAHGEVVRGYVGVSVQSVTPELARSFHLAEPHGALVAEVEKGSPGAQAGVQRGDVIVRWGDQTIDSSHDLPRIVAATPPGARVPLEIVRNGQRRTLTVRVEKMPRRRATPPQEEQEEEEEPE